MKIIIILLGIFIFTSTTFAQENTMVKSDIISTEGPYLGQKPPGTTAALFAKNITSKDYANGGFVFSKNVSVHPFENRSHLSLWRSLSTAPPLRYR